LNPKKSKELIPVVAKELEMDEILVKKVIDFYWNSVRKSMEDLKYPDIQIANFGRFVIKQSTFDKKIQRYKDYLDNQDNLTFGKYYKYKQVEEGYAKMIEVKKYIDERNEKKKSFKQNKNGNK
jgi:nucleoid DNA-binding protein